jgi:hypothetical protein
MEKTRLAWKIPKERCLETQLMTTFVSSSSNIPFKVEVNLEIPMFEGQVNIEFLYSWLKQMEFYFGLYQIQKAQ